MNEKHTLFTTTVGEKETMEKVGRHCSRQEIWQSYRSEYKKTCLASLKMYQATPYSLNLSLTKPAIIVAKAVLTEWTKFLGGKQAGDRLRIVLSDCEGRCA